MNKYLIWLTTELRCQSYPKATPPALLSRKHHLLSVVDCPDSPEQCSRSPQPVSVRVLPLCCNFAGRQVCTFQDVLSTLQPPSSRVIHWAEWGISGGPGQMDTHVHTHGHQPEGKAFCQNTAMLCNVAGVTWGENRAAGRRNCSRNIFLSEFTHLLECFWWVLDDC